MTAVDLRGLTDAGLAAGGGRWRRVAGPRLVAARLVAAAGFVAVGWGRPSLVLPALLAVPLAEVLVVWHAGQARRAVATHDDPRAVAGHLRALGRRTLLALVPPLLLASALFAVAAHPPAGRPLAHATAAHAAVGVLCAGGYALLLLLAAGGRLGRALTLVGLTAAGLAVGRSGVPYVGLWPALGGYLAGLVVAAVALFDVRTFWPAPAPAGRPR